MNLNDPFNRLSRQRQSDYVSFKETLSQSAINDVESVQALYSNTLKRALLVAIVVVLTATLSGFIQPALSAGIMIIAALILLWLFSTTFRARQFMRQYMRELRSRK